MSGGGERLAGGGNGLMNDAALLTSLAGQGHATLSNSVISMCVVGGAAGQGVCVCVCELGSQSADRSGNERCLMDN